MKQLIVSLLMIGGAASNVCAAVEPAYVSSNVQVNSLSSTQYSFGTNSITGIGEAQTIIGADASGTPFIQTLASTPSTAATKPYLIAGLDYSWDVTSTNGSTAPVLVHISTKGSIDSVYRFTPYQLDTYNLVPNKIDIGLRAYFTTLTSTGINYQTYGLQSGIGLGVTEVDPIESFTQQNGGSSVLSASFSATFDLWVTPNTQFANTIQMYVSTGFRQRTPFVEQYAIESYRTSIFLDPVITIDPSYGSQFVVNVSEIPLVAVPEPATYVLFIGGLGCLVNLAHRRKPLSERSA